MNPNDLTGRDLDAAVTEALGIDTPFPMGWNEPRKIPELFAEIRKRGGIEVALVQHPEVWEAGCDVERFRTIFVTGSTPSEALARLLLMVVGR